MWCWKTQNLFEWILNQEEKGGTFDITTFLKEKCLSDEQSFRKEKHEAL